MTTGRESLIEARYRADAERFRAIIQWLQENTPRVLDLCPYKVEKQ